MTSRGSERGVVGRRKISREKSWKVRGQSPPVTPRHSKPFYITPHHTSLHTSYRIHPTSGSNSHRPTPHQKAPQRVQSIPINNLFWRLPLCQRLLVCLNVQTDDGNLNTLHEGKLKIGHPTRCHKCPTLSWRKPLRKPLWCRDHNPHVQKRLLSSWLIHVFYELLADLCFLTTEIQEGPPQSGHGKSDMARTTQRESIHVLIFHLNTFLTTIYLSSEEKPRRRKIELIEKKTNNSRW